MKIQWIILLLFLVSCSTPEPRQGHTSDQSEEAETPENSGRKFNVFERKPELAEESQTIDFPRFTCDELVYNKLFFDLFLDPFGTAITQDALLKKTGLDFSRDTIQSSIGEGMFILFEEYSFGENRITVIPPQANNTSKRYPPSLVNIDLSGDSIPLRDNLFMGMNRADFIAQFIVPETRAAEALREWGIEPGEQEGFQERTESLIRECLADDEIVFKEALQDCRIFFEDDKLTRVLMEPIPE